MAFRQMAFFSAITLGLNLLAGCNESSLVDGRTQTQVAAVPTDPTDLKATGNDSFKVLLNWTDSSNNETGYLIERAEGAGAFVEIAKLDANSVQYSDLAVHAGVSYSYRLRAINDVGNSEYTEQVTVQTQALVLGFVGDSITYGVGCSSQCNAVYTATNTLIQAGNVVTSINKGVSGATTRDWQPTKYDFTSAIAAFTAAHVNVVTIMLGTNDSKTQISETAAEYKSNMSNIVAALLAPATGIKHVILQQPIYVSTSMSSSWTTNSDDLLQQYSVQLDQIPNVAKGDRTVFALFAATPSLLADGVHPNSVGHAVLGKAWATAILNAGL